MRAVVVVGTGSGCGKTTLACGILRAVPGLGAVKISPRAGASRVEWGAGEPGKDTDLYAGSGAAPVARIVGPRDQVARTWALIEPEFAGCRGVLFEGASALDLPARRYVVFVAGDPPEPARAARAGALQARADLVFLRSAPPGIEQVAAAVRAFLAGPAGS